MRSQPFVDAWKATCVNIIACSAPQDEKPGRISLRDLSRTVWILAATVVLIYVLTLAIFPGVLAEDVSNSNLGSWRARQTLYPQQYCPLWTCHAGFGHQKLSSKAAVTAQ